MSLLKLSRSAPVLRKDWRGVEVAVAGWPLLASAKDWKETGIPAALPEMVPPMELRSVRRSPGFPGAE